MDNVIKVIYGSTLPTPINYIIEEYADIVPINNDTVVYKITHLIRRMKLYYNTQRVHIVVELYPTYRMYKKYMEKNMGDADVHTLVLG